eukprot:3346010-Amphidinium_carterae.5
MVNALVEHGKQYDASFTERGKLLFGPEPDAKQRCAGFWSQGLKAENPAPSEVFEFAGKTLLKKGYVEKVNEFIANAKEDDSSTTKVLNHLL